VAGGAGGGGVVDLMAVDAAAHGRDACILGHGIDLGDVAVAHHALHAGLQMRAVRPGNSGGHLVNTHPGDGLIGFCEIGELHDCGPVFRHRCVARHAGAGSREGHLIAGIGIGVAGLASEALRDVQFVAERDGLRGGGVGRKVIPYLLLGRLRRLLRPRTEANQKHNRKSDEPAGDCSFARHRRTSQLLTLPPAALGIFLVAFVNFLEARAKIFQQSRCRIASGNRGDRTAGSGAGAGLV
jgi:hypothetical protein